MNNFHFCEVFKKRVKFVETESRKVVPRAGGWKKWGVGVDQV